MRGIFHGRAGTALAFVLGLLIATAGTATAAKLITGKQIKDGSVSAKDLTKAVQAKLARAGAPGPQGPKGDAGTPGAKGDTGPSTGPAGGALSGSYPNPSLASPQVRYLGAPPVLTQNSWSASNSPGFWKDGTGVVHLQGTVSTNGMGATDAVIFTLPDGFRPPNIGSRYFAVPVGGSAVGRLEISGTGQVRPQAATTDVALDGVSFLAG